MPTSPLPWMEHGIGILSNDQARLRCLSLPQSDQARCWPRFWFLWKGNGSRPWPRIWHRLKPPEIANSNPVIRSTTVMGIYQKLRESAAAGETTRSRFRRVSVSTLRTGVMLSHPVFEEGRTKLLAPGVPISEAMLNGLRVRGVSSVMVAEDDLVKLAPAEIQETAEPFICEKCGSGLPLRLTAEVESGVTWLCSHCGRSYRGYLHVDSPQELLHNIRPSKFEFDRTRLVPPSGALAQAVQWIVTRDYQGPDRRATKRTSVCLGVPVILVDDQYSALGEPFVATTRDISAESLALVHGQPIKAKFFVVELPTPNSTPLQLLVKVVRCRPIGSIYEIAGKFLRSQTESIIDD